MKIRNEFEILRIRNFVNHDHGQATDVDMEITVHSVGETSESIILESSSFLPNLRMSDSSGEEYPLLSNKYLRIMLADEADDGPDRAEAARLLAGIDSRKTYLLWFKTPLHRALQPRETRVLHLTYEYPRGEAGLLGSMRRLKTGAIRLRMSPPQPFPVFWVLNKPADYNISGRRYLKAKGGRLADAGSWENNEDAVCCRDTERCTSLHVRPDRSGAALSYSLTPKKIVLALPVAAIAMLSLLAASLAAVPHLDAGGSLQPIADAVVRHKVPLLLFIIASSLVVPRFIDDAYLRGGLFWLYFVPVGLALVSLVL